MFFNGYLIFYFIERCIFSTRNKNRKKYFSFVHYKTSSVKKGNAYFTVENIFDEKVAFEVFNARVVGGLFDSD